MDGCVSFPLFLLAVVLLTGSASSQMMLTLEDTSSCNISMIMEDLAADSVCLNSYNRVAAGNSSNIEFSVPYLCGTHCGVRFYNATKRACNGTELDFLQLHCSRNTAFQGEETIYCAYSELYEDLLPIFVNCLSVPFNGTCSSNCSYAVDQILSTLGCCLTERYNSPIGFLRLEDQQLAFLGNRTLYNTCGFTVPGECVPTYVDGNPVFVDPTPAPPSVPTVPPTSMATSDSHKMEVRDMHLLACFLFNYMATHFLITIILII